MINLLTDDRTKTVLFTGNLTNEQYDRIVNYPYLHSLYSSCFNSMLRVVRSHGYDTLLFHAYGWFEKLFLESIKPNRSSFEEYFLMCVPFKPEHLILDKTAYAVFDMVAPMFDEEFEDFEYYNLIIGGCDWVMHHNPNNEQESLNILKTAISNNIRTMEMDGNGGEIRYIYDAEGQKLATFSDGSFTYYRSVMVYGGTPNSNEQLLYITHPEGVIDNVNGTYVYKYFFNDYLGNVRSVAFADIETQTLIEEQATDYYPFGLAHSYSNLHKNRYLFSGKELQDAEVGESGFLGLYDFGARYYNPMLGRWFNIDPALQLTNPYLFCGNAPMVYVDPNGEFFFTFLCGFIPGLQALLPIAIQADLGWMTGGFGSLASGGSFWKGALAGGAIGAANGALSMISPLKIPLGGNFNLSVAPQIAIGTDGLGLGFNATLGYNYKGFNVGVNAGASYYASATGTGSSGWEGRLGYGIGYAGKHFQTGIGSTYFFNRETSQLTGQMYAGGGNWRVTYENDTWMPLPGLWDVGGPERDKFRTAAVGFNMTGGKLKGLNAGLNIFTGETNYGEVDASQGPNGTFDGKGGNKYRMGALYLGYGNARIGYNSERSIRGPIQNGFHNMFKYPHFKVLSGPNRPYFGFYSSNPYTVW